MQDGSQALLVDKQLGTRVSGGVGVGGRDNCAHGLGAGILCKLLSKGRVSKKPRDYL